MKEKLGRLLKWATGSLSLILKNNLVISGFCLITGVVHLILPKRALYTDALILSLLLIAYAAVSIVAVLTDNQTIAKGKETTGGWLKGFFDGKRKNTAADDIILKNDSATQAFAEETNKQIHAFAVKVSDKHDKTQSVGKIIVLVFYTIILAVSIFLLLKPKIAVNVNNVIIGAVLIASGIINIISVFKSKKEESQIKSSVFTVILSLLTLTIGVLFIVFSMDTATFVMQFISIMMIIKALADFILVIRNKEFKSSINDTVNQIKSQNKEAAEETKESDSMQEATEK